MSEEQQAPDRIWVQLYESLVPNTLSVNAYDRDPREVHDNGKPVYEYHLAPVAKAPEAECSLCARIRGRYPTISREVAHSYHSNEPPRPVLLLKAQAVADEIWHYVDQRSGVAEADKMSALVLSIAEPASLQPPSPQSEEIAREIVRGWEETPHSHVFANDATNDLVTRIASALTSAQARGAEQKWLPIETAPTDGRSFLVGIAGDSRINRAFFSRINRAFFMEGELLMVGGHFEPTHWTPLPDPPKQP